jgi:hypothetical protein
MCYKIQYVYNYIYLLYFRVLTRYHYYTFFNVKIEKINLDTTLNRMYTLLCKKFGHLTHNLFITFQPPQKYK